MNFQREGKSNLIIIVAVAEEGTFYKSNQKESFCLRNSMSAKMGK